MPEADCQALGTRFADYRREALEALIAERAQDAKLQADTLARAQQLLPA